MIRPTAAELTAIRERDRLAFKHPNLTPVPSMYSDRRALLAEVDALYDAIGASLNDLALGTDERLQRAEGRLRLVLGDVPAEVNAIQAQRDHLRDVVDYEALRLAIDGAVEGQEYWETVAITDAVWALGYPL